LPDIKLIKWERSRWAGREVYTRKEKRNAYGGLIGRPEGVKLLQDKLILKK
jgi:hypothetical protein